MTFRTNCILSQVMCAYTTTHSEFYYNLWGKTPTSISPLKNSSYKLDRYICKLISKSHIDESWSNHMWNGHYLVYQLDLLIGLVLCSHLYKGQWYIKQIFCSEPREENCGYAIPEQYSKKSVTLHSHLFQCKFIRRQL